MARIVRSSALIAVLGALAAACGQQGPLLLPEEAQPIERLPPPAAQTEQQDDERTRER